MFILDLLETSPELVLGFLSLMATVLTLHLVYSNGAGFSLGTFQAASETALLFWTTFAILFWAWRMSLEYAVGSWGIWEARGELEKLASGLRRVEKWRFGGREGLAAVKFLLWSSLMALCLLGFELIGSSTMALMGRALPSFCSSLAEGAIIFQASLWVLYEAYWITYRMRTPCPVLPDEDVPAVPSALSWLKTPPLIRKQRKKEEALALVSAYRESCPLGIPAERKFPVRLVAITLPLLTIHEYLWFGGKVPLARDLLSSLDLLSGGILLALMALWYYPFLRGFGRRKDICKNWELLRLVRMAERIAGGE